MNDQPLSIGIGGQTYTEKRNIIGALADANYVLCRDIYSARRRLNEILNWNWISGTNDPFKFRDHNFNNVKLYHLWNTVYYGQKPWVATFGSLLPRFKQTLSWQAGELPIDSELRGGLAALTRPNCKKLIATSQCAANIQRMLITATHEVDVDCILEKTTVLHPPQKLIVTDDRSYSSENSSGIKVMMLGHHFFRKGGAELVRAIETLNRKGASISLIIVSKLESDLSAFPMTPDQVSDLKRRIATIDWITRYAAMSPEAVVELMKTVDVGALPSFAEAYGYAVLEFQACGVPVITTDVRAFPEINNNDAGWLIEVPKSAKGEASYKTDAQRDDLSQLVEQGLIDILTEICQRKKQIAEKGNNAVLRIRQQHCPDRHASELRKIYSEALQ